MSKIFYKTTDLGISGACGSRIRVTNLTEGGTQSYEFHHTPDGRILAVAAMSRTPYELVDQVGSDAKNFYYMTDEDPKRVV
jgi:hypothetical protein